MIKQITPGELEGLFHAQELAVNKLKEWLPKYIFKHGKKTNPGEQLVKDEIKDSKLYKDQA